jgi:type III restriction enzyme
VEDARKFARLKLWCEDATAQDAPREYRALFVRQEDWDRLVNPLMSLGEAAAVFTG